jgi:hypothetical protein
VRSGLLHGPSTCAARKTRLVNLGATTLNEEYQHDHKQHTANNPDNCYIVHVMPPFVLMRKIGAERLRHDNHLRPQSNYK